jgi:hypothetical protein
VSNVIELAHVARTLLNQPNAVHELGALADEIDPPIAIRQGIAVAQYINGKRIAAKFMGAPSPLSVLSGALKIAQLYGYHGGAARDKFARIRKAGRDVRAIGERQVLMVVAALYLARA